MTLSLLARRSFVRTLLGVLLAAPATAQATAHDADGRARSEASTPSLAPDLPPAVALALEEGATLRELHYDAPGDGSLWARGATYKIGFDSGGATYYPDCGPSAPRNYQHQLSPDTVEIGGRALPFEPRALPVREGDRVELDRGSFVEVYELGARSLEQIFVFPTLPRRGELVLRIPVGSEFEGSTHAAGITFAGPFGEVSYGRATAIDANGRRQDAPTLLLDGVIEIRVPAEFVASAALPLVVDPLIDNLQIPGLSNQDDYSPDVAWEPFHQVWLVVYERTFSASDTDLLARVFTASGTTIYEGAIDLSTQMWQRPRVANLAAAKQFLAVAEVTEGGAKSVRGRTIEPAGTILSFGAKFTISEPGSADKLRPDVGGDPYETQPSYYCVVYQTEFSASDKRIAVRQVDSNGALVGGAPTYLGSSGVIDTDPSVSNSNQTSEWLISWMRDHPISFGDIWAAYVRWDGFVTHPAFPVSTSSQVESLPCSSTRLGGLGTANPTAIAFQRLNFVGLQADVMVSLLQGPNVVQTVNISTLENSGFGSRKQHQPSIDSNGAHFLVGYSEFNPVFGHDELFVSDLFASGNVLGVSQPHVQMGLWGLPQLRSRIAAQHAPTSFTNRFAVTYDITHNETNRDVIGQLFDVFSGGTATTICTGDGNGVGCPCGNQGAPGRGCANSASGGGALLTLSGAPSTIADTAVLQAFELPNLASCLFFQGTGASGGTVFGDGIRCVNGSVVRLAVKVAAGGTVSFPEAGDPPLHVRGQIGIDGGAYTYQLWYRDTASFCTSHPFNLTNGLRVSWAR